MNKEELSNALTSLFAVLGNIDGIEIKDDNFIFETSYGDYYHETVHETYIIPIDDFMNPDFYFYGWEEKEKERNKEDLKKEIERKRKRERAADKREQEAKDIKDYERLKEKFE